LFDFVGVVWMLLCGCSVFGFGSHWIAIVAEGLTLAGMGKLRQLSSDNPRHVY
jgi:hypothetical protein